jgi:VanZ family protein
LTGSGFRRLWIGMIAALAAIIILASVVPFQVPGAELSGDKFGHLFAYFALALAGAGIVPADRVWIVMLRCLLLGFALEIVQGLWLEERQADWRDMLANSAGVACAWLIAHGDRSGWARHIEDWLRRR